MKNDEYIPPQADVGLGILPTQENRLAHPAKRFQAQFIDGLVAIAIFFMALFVNTKLIVRNDDTDLITVLIAVAYYLFADALPKGQSIGKRLLGMAVVDRKTGKSCNILQSFIRNGVTPIFGIFDSLLIFTKSRRRIGDYMARTIVIKVND